MLGGLNDVFVSDGPDPHGPPELMQFGRFVGAWDLDVICYDEQGEVSRRLPGEWHFGWALEGRAVADVWIVPSRSRRDGSGPPSGEYGMSLRFFDPDIDAWRSTWLGPVHKVVLPFLAKQVGDEMRLERTDGDRLVRWSFSEITPSSFRWRNTTSDDGGEKWRLEQEFFACRTA